MAEFKLDFIQLIDGTIVDLRPSDKGEPDLELKNGKWQIYSGDSAELFLGRRLTDSEIAALPSVETPDQ